MTTIEQLLTELHRRHVPTQSIEHDSERFGSDHVRGDGMVLVEHGVCSCGVSYTEFANHVTQEILGRFMVMPTHLAEDLLAPGESFTD